MEKQSDPDAYLDFMHTEPTQRLYLHMCICIHTHLHTVVTDAAVRAAGRPVEMAGGAPLHPDLNALDLHVLVERCSEIIILVLVFIRWQTQDTDAYVGV